jgi:hypothetical protein
MSAMDFRRRLLRRFVVTQEEVLAPLCSREEAREAIVETLNELGWKYSMLDADTYAAETDWSGGLTRVVLITLRKDDAVVVSNRTVSAYTIHDRDDVDTFTDRFLLCVSRYQRR